MTLGIYAVLGIFLTMASRDPMKHRSLIWFTVWSSVVRASVMLVHVVTDPGEMGRPPGDVAGLYIVAITLAVLTPRRTNAM